MGGPNANVNRILSRDPDALNPEGTNPDEAASTSRRRATALTKQTNADGSPANASRKSHLNTEGTKDFKCRWYIRVVLREESGHIWVVGQAAHDAGIGVDSILQHSSKSVLDEIQNSGRVAGPVPPLFPRQVSTEKRKEPPVLVAGGSNTASRAGTKSML